jgi:hypothetical protein
MNNKKGQLFALELKELAIGFSVGVVLILVALVVLKLTGRMPSFIENFLCNCAAK